MNTKNILYALIVTASTINLYTSETNERPHQLSEEQWQYIIDRSKPKDKTKTPSSPDIIEHGGSDIKGGRNFYRKRIYFGALESGEPHYGRIKEHAQNPDFGNVRLVVFRQASFLSSFLSYFSFVQDPFEVIGTFDGKQLSTKVESFIVNN